MLLKTKRFLPLMITQFLGALNDNLFKNALLTLVTVKMTAQSDILSNLIAGLFILPFFCHGRAAGGQISARQNRPRAENNRTAADARGGFGLLPAQPAASDRDYDSDGCTVGLFRAGQIRPFAAAPETRRTDRRQRLYRKHHLYGDFAGADSRHPAAD